MTDDDLSRLLERELARRDALGRLRRRRMVRGLDATHVEIDGRRLINFASNDYLGLTHHPRVLHAIAESVAHGGGSGAAGLISGHSPLHESAERAIAQWKNKQAAVLLPSGYQANLAAIQTLSAAAEGQGRAIRFLVDRLVHASLIDAVRATGAAMRVFPHNHLGKLERLLRDAQSDEMQVVVTESIFSMDGDAADLRGLAELKRRHAFVLLLDEAHGSGVYGDNGAGYAAECGLEAVADVSVVTLSKALGCAGGAICASQLFCNVLLNHGRAYIYSTAVAPALAAGSAAAIDVLHHEPQRRMRVRALAKRVREELGVEKTEPADSPIVPILLKTESAALSAADRLMEEGLLVIAIRPPTVPHGSSRLRVTLSSEHTDEEIERVIQAIKQLP
jgi:8-amino-7-oxononanoate synthase